MLYLVILSIIKIVACFVFIGTKMTQELVLAVPMVPMHHLFWPVALSERFVPVPAHDPMLVYKDAPSANMAAAPLIAVAENKGVLFCCFSLSLFWVFNEANKNQSLRV
jgi:hypothetical protein